MARTIKSVTFISCNGVHLQRTRICTSAIPERLHLPVVVLPVAVQQLGLHTLPLRPPLAIVSLQRLQRHVPGAIIEDDIC